MKILIKILKLVILPLLIAIAIYSFIRFALVPKQTKKFEFKNITVDEYKNIYFESKESIVFITKNDTDKRNEYEETIKQKFDGKNIDVYYLDISYISDNELKELDSITNLDSKKKYELPLLVYTLNGEVYDMLKGYQEPHYVVDFIQKNNIN